MDFFCEMSIIMYVYSNLRRGKNNVRVEELQLVPPSPVQQELGLHLQPAAALLLRKKTRFNIYYFKGVRTTHRQ